MNNRIYKFRTWDKRDKKMVCFVLEDLLDLQGKIDSDYLGIQDNPSNRMYETVMQYTGFRDRKRTKEFPKGQEIYEGDIVKNEADVIGWVEYCNNCGCYEVMTSETTSMVEPAPWNFWEVKGNVFENPKLLKENK